ncbi:SMP-30/gluconolactonase/LRE family protein [Amaricoccus sp.]|uniref:SMP-30/gluconolactonase/LRE family protein n=1 Tax=Amaricoccus sp. TaxID=1872485 RepID=UPI001B624AA2|nr:SMP-30/gluconolactonase/LRE family protein [Amaricoccus sp.]MBP7002659.1 SMP-30/gluconolactonase/LRE family protein [Amaricoccus sp.]
MEDVLDARRCELGEGALWHPERGQLFWLDIHGRALLGREGAAERAWDFGEQVSAAGWIDRDHLLVAGEGGLWRFAIPTGERERVAAMPPEEGPRLRSNDGRADPWGGFWFGTMGKRAEDGAGSLWRYWRGELRRLRPGLSVPNAICFDAEAELGFFADTRAGNVWRQRLDPASGWPAGEAEVWLALAGTGRHPDGAVIDAEGRFWNAQWESSLVACYGRDGRLLHEEAFAASRLTCPAFGGADLATLFVTSAQEGMDEAAREAEPAAGMTFARRVDARGRAEPAVVL